MVARIGILYAAYGTKEYCVASVAILLEKVKPAEAKGSLKGLLPDLMEDDNQVLVVAQLVN